MAESRHPASQAGRPPGQPPPSQPPPSQPPPSQPRADERDARFRQVECDRCGAAVLVAKFSQQHTSVQWSEASVRGCAEFVARVAMGEQTALIDTCASLRDSIDRAVRQERLEVAPP
jgi:hypothetical protein